MGFKFKLFSLIDDNCAMKVSTDAVLLATLTDLIAVTKVLDLGCGCGIVGLMLAQRLSDKLANFEILGVDIANEAIDDAKTNAKNSPWADKVNFTATDIFDFSQKSLAVNDFDLVVANPPYFSPALACRDNKRDLARYNYQGLQAWLTQALSYLNPLNNLAKICFILPHSETDNFIYEYQNNTLLSTKLSLVSDIWVYSDQAKMQQNQGLKFRILTFSWQKNHMTDLMQTKMCIRQANNQYHPDFIELIKDFYLKF